MEIIKNWLLNDEKILWENHYYSKIDRRYSFLISSSFLFLNIFFFAVTRGLEVILYPILFTFNPIVLGAVFLDIFTLLRDKKNAELKWKDFKKYHMFAVLTNRRWIQKDLNVISTEETDDIVNKIEHYKDIVFIQLESIKLIELSERKELRKWKYFVTLYFSYDKKKPKKMVLGAQFSSKIQNQTLLDNLKSLRKTKHEEIDQIRKNQKIFQFYY